MANLKTLLVTAVWLSLPTSTGPVERKEAIVIPDGAIWSYYAQSRAPIDQWQNGGGTAGWKYGALPIGYSTSDNHKGIATILTSADEPGLKHPVGYFRKVFRVPRDVKVASLSFSLGCDDGCIAYLNGVEIGRIRIRPGVAGPYNAIGWEGDPPLVFQIPVSQIRTGQNVLAVEVHQVHPSSSDLVFFEGRLSMN